MIARPAATDFGSAFTLTLLTNDPELAAEADAAGVDRVGLDFERAGKAERQAGVDGRIADHSWDDLAAVARQLVRADLFLRLNALHANTPAEVETALSAGVRVLMLPFFKSPGELRQFASLVRGRAKIVALLETAAAAVRIRDILKVPGIDEVMLGLNDLRLQFGVASHFEVLASPLVDALAAEVHNARLPLAIGGVARPDDTSLPVPPQLVYARLVQLNATPGFRGPSSAALLPTGTSHTRCMACAVSSRHGRRPLRQILRKSACNWHNRRRGWRRQWCEGDRTRSLRVRVSHGSSMIFCSVVAQNCLLQARILAESLAEYHPHAKLELFVADAPDQATTRDEPFRRVGLSEAGIAREELWRRLTMYERQALASSLKATLLAACLARTGGPVLLLDADMLAFAPLDDLGELAMRHGILLTPHTAVPMRFKAGGFGPEQAFLRAGVFNGGFVGVSAKASEFLRWWSERCARDCVLAFDRGICLSQNWLALVPSLFDHHVLRDRGINLTGHGMGEEDIEWRGRQPWIGDTPLRLFHFASKFDPVSGEFAAARDAHWWPRSSERPGFARLCQVYATRLMGAGFDGVALEDEALDWVMRAAYRRALIEAEANALPEPPNPFANGMAEFTAWLAEPASTGHGLSRYLSALYAGRPDLQAVFPNVPGEGQRDFLAWVASKCGGELPVGLPVAAARS